LATLRALLELGEVAFACFCFFSGVSLMAKRFGFLKIVSSSPR